MKQINEPKSSIEIDIQGGDEHCQESNALLEILAIGRKEIEAGEYQLASDVFIELRTERQGNP